MREHAGRLRHEGKAIVLVPTMGYFHEGHLSLIRKGREMGDELVVSIFVNPTQFGSGEDFNAYPKDFERDFSLARKEKTNVVFAPEKDELYADRFQSYVTLEKLPRHLCGISRPIHFRGVATVLTKLFHIVQPQIAIFGRKDYQQLLVIRQMVKDLNFDINIVGGPIVREPDGLAMSSRNNNLTEAQRSSATSLYRSLLKARTLVKSGTTDAAAIISAAAEVITACPDTAVDYIAVCDPDTLEDIAIIDGPAMMALAVKIGNTRLIDNMMLIP